SQKSPRRRQLHFLRRVEPAVRGASLYHNRDGLLARTPDRKSAKPFGQEAMARGERLHEPQHARVLQIREFPASEFPMAPCPGGNNLSTAASGHSAAGWNFFLHFSFALLHPRYLPRRAQTDALVARFHSRGLVFPAAGSGPNRARGRFS